MKVGDLVRAKEMLKPVGVMGSTLKKYKKFEGIAIVLRTSGSVVTIMNQSGGIISVKDLSLELVE